MLKLKKPTSPYPFNKVKRKSELKANFKIIAVLRFEKTYPHSILVQSTGMD